MPRTNKVGCVPVEGPRFMVKQDSYKAQYPDSDAVTKFPHTDNHVSWRVLYFSQKGCDNLNVV